MIEGAERAAYRLRSWREFRGLTQAQLADLVGTTTAVISHLETGKRGLSAKWLYRLAPALGISPGVLLDRSPGDVADLLELWSRISEDRRPHARRILSTFIHSGCEFLD